MTMTDAELRARLVRRASRAVVGGFRPPDDPFSSWLGRVRVALPGETWPEHSGRPMMPLAQFNLTELPHRTDSLGGVALITVFIQQDGLPLDTPNGDGWLLRAYPTLEGLAVTEEPAARAPIKSFPVRWELVKEDYPTWDDASGMGLPPDVEEDYHDRFQTQQGTKIGGWPDTIQSEIYWAPFNRHPANPEYVFQIDSEEKARWAWGDGGVGYFGRGTGEARDQWTLAWQCY